MTFCEKNYFFIKDLFKLYLDSFLEVCVIVKGIIEEGGKVKMIINGNKKEFVLYIKII